MLLETRDEGTFYTGPLEAGKALASQDRTPAEGWVTVQGQRRYRVLLGELDRSASADLFDWADIAEWGQGETPEEAWRYALGAMFGPADADYDDQHLQRALQRHKS